MHNFGSVSVNYVTRELGQPYFLLNQFGICYVGISSFSSGLAMLDPAFCHIPLFTETEILILEVQH